MMLSVRPIELRLSVMACTEHVIVCDERIKTQALRFKPDLTNRIRVSRELNLRVYHTDTQSLYSDSLRCFEIKLRNNQKYLEYNADICNLFNRSR